MIHNAQLQQEAPRPDLTKAILKRIAQILGTLVITGALLFGTARTFNWFWAWAYLGTAVFTLLVASTVMLPGHPEVVAERASPGQNVKAWDRRLTQLLAVFVLAVYPVAGIEFYSDRWPGMALWLHLLGIGLYAVGYTLIIWAMASNRFFSTAVRIQTDRGHTVSTGGPYAWVRHPGYVGMILSAICTPLVLGSWWGFVPAVLSGLIYVIRTVLEDRTLQDELPGYKEYASHVKYRLIPYVW